MPEAITETPAAQPSIQQRVDALTGDAEAHWRSTGDLAAAEAKNSAVAAPVQAQPEIDVTPESSPGTPSEETPEVSESEAASEPAEVEQPVKGETPEQKSERKRRNDERRWDRVTRERAEYKAKLELLEKQLAEKNAAPAPAPEQPKARLTSRPKLPKMSEFDSAQDYDAAMETHQDLMDQWYEQVYESRESSRRQQTEAEKGEAAFRDREKAAKTKYADFDRMPYLRDDFPASVAMNFVVRNDAEGFDYAHALTAKEGERIRAMTDIPDFDNLLKTNPPRASYLLGEAVARARFEMQKLLNPAAPPRKPTGQEPTSDVRLDRPGIPTSGDARARAIASGDFDTFRRIENEKHRKRV